MPLPYAEPIGLPAPAWLLQLLLVLTFVLHVLPMSVTLGGTLAATWYEIRGRVSPAGPARALATRLWSVLPACTSFTITMGVAPLLFVQLLYPKFFYPASVLTGWSWFAVVPLLIVGYYLLYLQTMGAKEGRWRPWAGLLSSLIFMAVALTLVSTLSLTVEPERWRPLYAESQAGLAFLLRLPRWLHVLLGATAMAGGVIYLLGQYMERGFSLYTRRAGLHWLGASLLLQVPVSFWYLSTLSSEGALSLWLPATAGALAVVAFVVALAGHGGEPVPAFGWGTLLALSLSTALLAVQRHLVRQALLSPHLNAATDWKLQPQWDLFLLFALLLVGTISLLGYLTARYLRATRARESDRVSHSA